MTNEEKARKYLLYEHKSPLNNILHQCDLKTEFQYHKDIETAFIKGAEWKDEKHLKWLKENLAKETSTMFTSESQGVINFEPVIEAFKKYLNYDK